MNEQNILQQITDVLNSSGDRISKAQRIAEEIRLVRNYRWVGIYDVDEQEIQALAWSGIGAPAYRRFPVTRGLSGHAVTTRSTVISNDVANDPRYLTAFGSTRSEMIVPVIDREREKGIGTIDVESARKNAFHAADQKLLEACARTVILLWR